jgi:hypothetical protein
MFRDNVLLSGGVPADKLPPYHLPLGEQLPDRLQEQLQRLRLRAHARLGQVIARALAGLIRDQQGRSLLR